MSEPDYVAKNRDGWTRTNAEYTDRAAERAWSDRPFSWGVFGVPEADLDVLGDVAGLDVIELGCGTAYFAAWFARQGARPVGVDVTPAQLETARRMQEKTGLTFPLIEANAEDVPLPDAIVRPRRLRVRSEPLVRPVPLDPGGATGSCARADGSSS